MLLVNQKNRRKAALFLLFLFIVFSISTYKQEADAIAGVDDAALGAVMITVAIVFLVAAGYVFVSTGDAQKAADAFLSNSESAFNFCKTIAQTAANGVVQITHDALDFWPGFWNDMVSYFNRGVVTYSDVTVLQVKDFHGSEIQYFNTSIMQYHPMHSFTGTLPFNIASMPYGIGTEHKFYVSENTYYSYRFYRENNGLYLRQALYSDGAVVYETAGSAPAWNSTDATSRMGLFKETYNGADYLIPFLWFCDPQDTTKYYSFFTISPTYLANDYMRGTCISLNGMVTIPKATDIPVAKDPTVDQAKVNYNITTYTEDGTKSIPLPQDNAITKPIAQSLTGADTAITTPPPAVTTAQNEGNIKMLLFTKFPFCLPWDLYNAVRLIAAPPEAPKFSVDLLAPLGPQWVNKGKIELDMAQYEVVGTVIRWASTVEFCLMLILSTRKLIWG